MGESDKRGMSQVVTILLVSLISMATISIVWVVVGGLMEAGSSKINLDQLTLDLAIERAVVNQSTGIASVKVARNSGEGDLTEIKFIVEDSRNSEIFEEDAIGFYELARRTYDLNLSSRPFIDISDIQRISIAPVYVSGGGSGESLADISDTVKGDSIIGADFGEGDEGEPTAEEGSACVTDADCPDYEWVADTAVCSGDLLSVMQAMDDYYCLLDICRKATDMAVRESCIDGAECYGYPPTCLDEPIACTEATVEADCGTSGPIGVPTCNIDNTAVEQDYQDYMCVSDECVSLITPTILQDCVGEEICFQGECFIPDECSSHADCDGLYGPGYICVDGACEPEEMTMNGSIRSAWPFGVGEYFDSADLPLEIDTQPILGYSIIFPLNPLAGCLEIIAFGAPVIPGGYSYVRLNPTPTNITDGDYYEIWETQYACTL